MNGEGFAKRFFKKAERNRLAAWNGRGDFWLHPFGESRLSMGDAMENKTQPAPKQVSESTPDVEDLADRYAAQAVKTVKLSDAGMSVLDELATEQL
jgi:hypothetical protein